MGKKLFSNLSLKILSVFAAIFLWFIVIIIIDPVTTKSFDVSVKILNTNFVTENGKVYTILDESNTIRVVLTGKGTVLDKIKAEDIVATADMQELIKWGSEDEETLIGTIAIEVSCSGIKKDNIKNTPQTVKVAIEDSASKEFVIAVTTEGTKPATGYVVGTATPHIKTVSISGAKSLIDKIQRVEAPVNVTKLSYDKQYTDIGLNIYDKNDDLLSTSQLNDLEFSTVTRQAIVDVEVDLWRIRTDIELQVETSGIPADGYRITGLEVAPATISVAGTEEALNDLAIAGNKISIGEISIAEAKNDVEETINIIEYLPNETTLVEAAGEIIFVTARISPLTSKILDIPISEIFVNGLNENLVLVFEKPGNVKIEVKGLEEELEKLEEIGIETKDIRAEIDLSGRIAGSYNVDLKYEFTTAYKEILKEAGIDFAHFEMLGVKISVIIQRRPEETTGLMPSS